jgi:hypothetical protein
MIKNIIIIIFITIIISYLFDVHINKEQFEDNSGRITITYCMPNGYCD